MFKIDRWESSHHVASPCGAVRDVFLVHENACLMIFIYLMELNPFLVLTCIGLNVVFLTSLKNVSVALRAEDLEKFLKSIGKDPCYVDLEVICGVFIVIIIYLINRTCDVKFLAG